MRNAFEEAEDDYAAAEVAWDAFRADVGHYPNSVEEYEAWFAAKQN